MPRTFYALINNAWLNYMHIYNIGVSIYMHIYNTGVKYTVIINKIILLFG